MADIKEAIRRMIYQYVVDGADKVVASQQAITAATTTTDKAALSLEKQFGNLERRYVSSVRQQQDYQKAQEKINDAVKQNPALQERANVVLAALNEQYNRGTIAQKAFATATSGVQGQLLAMSAGAGPVGVFLSSLGPWGLAAATGLGAASAVFNRLVEGAERIGNKSIELRKFSDVTGLAVTQIKALTQAGGRLGVDADEIETSLEKFSVGLNEARKGSGSLFEQVRAINPQLALELANTTNAAQGWDILAKALRSATEASQRNALARAAFGRGGIETGLVAVESANAGGIDKMAKGVSLTQQWVTETAKLRAENVQLEKSFNNAMDAAYALPVLQRQNEFLKARKELVELMASGKSAPAVGMGAPLPQLVTRGPSDMTDFNEAIAAAGKAERAGAAAAAAFKLDPETMAGWQQLDDAMGAAVLQSNQVVSSLEQQKNATALAANTERERVSLLGAAATEQEKLNVQTLALKVALDQNKISQEDYTRAAAGLTKHYRDAEIALRGQLSVAQSVIGLSGQEAAYAQAQAQYEATINNLERQRVPLSEAILQADLQRQIAMAQIVKAEEEAAQQKREQLKAAKELADTSVFAKSVAEQNVRRNEEIAQADKEQADANQRAANFRRREADETERILDNVIQMRIETTKYLEALPLTLMAMSLMNPYQMGKDAWEKGGRLSQFNPAGYTSTSPYKAALLTGAVSRYGMGGFTESADPMTGAPIFTPNAQGLEKLVNASGGSMGSIISGLSSKDPGQLSATAGLLSRITNLLPEGEKPGAIQQQLEMLKGAPPSLARDELIKQLTDQLKQLADATKENTDATSAMTDVLSPFYSSDPRQTHLGFRAFAGGGIMSQYGELPIKHYQGGGMATSPQVAVFGEGSTPEAYVPVPAGRIPVEIRAPANSNQRQRPVVVNINVMGSADSGTVAALRSTSFQQAQAMRRMMR